MDGTHTITSCIVFVVTLGISRREIIVGGFVNLLKCLGCTWYGKEVIQGIVDYG